MKRYSFAGLPAVSFSIVFIPTIALSQTNGGAIGRGAIGTGNDGADACTHSPICAWGRGRNTVIHEERTPDLGFTYAYPFALPDGLTGGISAVAINSKGHLFAFQRNPTGKPQLFEFDENHKLVRAIGDDVIGHQNKAHGMAIRRPRQHLDL